MNSRKLFLSSSFKDVSQYFESFLGQPTRNKRVTFIPTASIPEEYKGYVDNDRKAFEQLGVIVDELNVSEFSKQIIRETIERNDLIYVSGGNAFYLLQEMKESGTDKLIIQEIQKGKVYIGASAGSIIMSMNINYIEKIDDKSKAKRLTNFDSLGVVDFYTLPHHTNHPFKEKVEEIINEYKDKINLIPISNTEVIQVSGNKVDIIGIK